MGWDGLFLLIILVVNFSLTSVMGVGALGGGLVVVYLEFALQYM